MTTVEILKAARAKIADEKHWTQVASARDSQGIEVSPVSPKAVSWCSTGALTASAMTFPDAAWNFIWASMKSPPAGMGFYNDSHTHAEVLAAWDAAIADAEKAVTA